MRMMTAMRMGDRFERGWDESNERSDAWFAWDEFMGLWGSMMDELE